jgi:hypothetical protein
MAKKAKGIFSIGSSGGSKIGGGANKKGGALVATPIKNSMVATKR